MSNLNIIPDYFSDADKELNMLVNSCNIKLENQVDFRAKERIKEEKKEEENIEKILNADLKKNIGKIGSDKFKISDDLGDLVEKHDGDEEGEKNSLNSEEKQKQEELLKKLIMENKPGDNARKPGDEDNDEDLEDDIDDYISRLEQEN
jgi:hypothetical protein